MDEKKKSSEKQPEEVRGACETISSEGPASCRSLILQGLIEFQRGRPDEAEASLRKALLIDPDSVDANYGYGTILMVRQKHREALAMMQRVVALAPEHGKAHHAIGRMLKDTGDLAGGLDALEKSLKINPHDIDVLTDRGNTLKDMGRLPEATLCHERALGLSPGNHLVMNNLAVVRFLNYELEGAVALYESALAVRPDFPEALSNLATVRRLQGDFEGAISCCLKALSLQPDYPEALNNLGNALKDARRLEEAAAVYERAVALRPDDADFHLNLAMAMLGLGRFEKGWKEYGWRWKTRHLSSIRKAFEKPEWEGEPGEGRVILLHAEQGFGDTLQFCRYAPMVKERGFRVMMLVERPLARLLQSLCGVEKVICEGAPLPEFDLHWPMMSLPFALGTTVETIPAEIPYLRADPADVEKWRERLGTLPEADLRVGLVWAGSSRSRSPDLIAADRARSIGPEKFATLGGVRGVRFFSLQKDGAKAPDGFDIIDWMEHCKDFGDTAAFITNLDLVIGVDSAVAHLAGALGKPFWLLNRFNSCWRWLIDREDSPWYPGVLRVFNQKRMGDWDEVFARVRSALCLEAGADP